MIPIIRKDAISKESADELFKIIYENISSNMVDYRYYNALLTICIESIERSESPVDTVKISTDDFSTLVNAFMKQNIAVDQAVGRINTTPCNYDDADYYDEVSYEFYYECPICKCDVGGRYSHCRKCGQLINWI